MTFSLSQRIVRTAGLFQGLVALPTMLVMGEEVFEQLFYYYYSFRVYYFITATFNSLMAAGIIFILILQRGSNSTMSKSLTLGFEAAKSALATAVWIWLMMDSIFGPKRRYSYQPDVRRTPRIIRSAISIVCLLFLYYPTLVYVFWDKQRDNTVIDEEGVAAGDEGAGERTPLLRE